MLQLWAISSQSKSKVFLKHKGTRAQRISENGRQVFGLSSSSGLICSSLVFGTLRVQLPVEVHLQRRKTRPKQGCIIYFEFNIGSFLHNCFKVSLTKIHIEKCTLEKYTIDGKIHFAKIHFAKIHFGKNTRFTKIHFGKYILEIKIWNLLVIARKLGRCDSYLRNLKHWLSQLKREKATLSYQTCPKSCVWNGMISRQMSTQYFGVWEKTVSLLMWPWLVRMVSR